METEFILLKLCAGALAILWLLAIWRGWREFAAMFRRLRQGDGFSLNLWLVVPFLLAAVLAGSWIGVWFFLPADFVKTFDPADVLGDSDVFFRDIFKLVRDSATWIWGPALLLLIFIPIVHAFLNRDFFWHLYVVGVLGILAMPFALIACGTFLERETTQFDSARVDFVADGANAYGDFGRYGLRHVTPSCTLALMNTLKLKTYGHATYSPEKDRARQLFQLWLNDTFNGATVDVPAAFGCQVTQIEPNPNYLPITLTLGFYRAFVALVLIGMVVRPFVRV